MYTLNLETLSEERLRKAVDNDTFQRGQTIFARGEVQVLEANDLAALCTVPDKRNYRVEIKVGREYVYLKCSCSHAGRGLICEHDVAAWLALREQLTRQLPSPWQAQITQVLESGASLPSKPKPAPYLLFFSLQQDIRS